jgi:hypothetical protein
MPNQQSALGQFSIGRVGQFSISADIVPSVLAWQVAIGVVSVNFSIKLRLATN